MRIRRGAHSRQPVTDATRLAAVPLGFAKELSGLNGIEIIRLESACPVDGFDGIVVDSSISLPEDWSRFVHDQAAAGLPVYDAISLYETAAERIPVTQVSFVPALQAGSRSYQFFKRLVDILIVLLTLPVSLPLSLVLSLAIALDSRGPIIFRQERVGKDNVLFTMFKFRSMRYESEYVARFATEETDRITRVGRILRRFRLDELPQLWNVLRGDMALIGPRPEQVPFVEQFEQEIPYYSWRHRVKPGITGLAQVEQGYAAGVEETREKLEYDLYYVKHISLSLDLSILMRTIRVVLGGVGSK